MLLMLLFLGGGESAATPAVDTHDGAGWAIHQLAQDREHKRARIKRPDQIAEIAGEMRAALAPKVPKPAPVVVQVYDDEEEILCLFMI